jgi:nitroreductase
MEMIDALLNRVSAVRLGGPAPDEEELTQMLRCAARAPDHGRLRPWRFTVVRGDGLLRFGDLMAEAHRQNNLQASVEELERVRAKATRAPLIVVVTAKVDTGHAVPAIEQVLTAGAATLLVILAANALGYGAMWRTGASAYSPVVKSALGLGESDAIVGYLYVGKSAAQPASAPSTELAKYVTHWDTRTK